MSPCLWIICLRTVSCVTNAPFVSGWFVIVLLLDWPMFPVSLDGLSSYGVLCDQCSLCLCVVCYCNVSCVTNVPCVSELFFFVLCPVWSMIPVFLDDLSLYCVLCDQSFLWLWIVSLRTVSCVTSVPCFSRLFAFVLCLVWPMFSVSLNCLSSYCVLCDQCSLCLWVVCYCTVSCVTNVPCLEIVCLRTVSCVTNVPRVSGWFVIVMCLVWSMFPVSLSCFFSYCVLCDQCSLCLWMICHSTVSCVTNVPCVYKLFVFLLCLVWSMFPVSLDGFSLYCILCDPCSQCLWIIYLRTVSCVTNVPCVSGWFFFVLFLVGPMFPVSLDGLSL